LNGKIKKDYIKKSGGIRVKNIRKIVAAALVSVFVVGASGCGMISKTEAGIKKSPVAKFDSTTITKGQLDEKMAPLIEQLKAQYGDKYMDNAEAKDLYTQYQKQYLDNMILEKIILKKADEKKITVDEKAITDETEKLKAAYTEDQVKQMGYKDGYNDAQFKADIKNSLTSNKLFEESTKEVTVDDAKVEEYFNTNKLQYTEKPNTIQISHILTEKEEDAKKAKERLDKGEDFVKVAKEMSTDTVANEKGGDLGVLTYDAQAGAFVSEDGGQLDQTFMTAALALKEGQVSAPVNTQFGWHVIKTTKKVENPVKRFQDVKEEIKTGLLGSAKQTKMSELVEQWKTDAKIKYYEDNL
jgi:foldase protein PrsA